MFKHLGLFAVLGFGGLGFQSSARGLWVNSLRFWGLAVEVFVSKGFLRFRPLGLGGRCFGLEGSSDFRALNHDFFGLSPCLCLISVNPRA